MTCEVKISRGRLKEVMEVMCDEYCMWPTASLNQDVLDKHCEECPLNNISNEEYPLGYCPYQE